MELSVVIISWNSRQYLEKCLESLRPLFVREDVELIWVDNGSADGSCQMMAREYPRATTIRLDRNYGVAYARNRGIEASRGRYVLLLDDDTMASPKAISALLEYIKGHPDVGICGPSLWSEDRALQPSFKEYPGIGVKMRNVINGLLKKEKETALPDNPLEPCYLIGACQMIRREVFDACGLLDENIFYGPEDADFCIRAREKGWRIVYLPDVAITHHWRRITNRNMFSPTAFKHAKALAYFYRKHHRLW